MRSLLITGVAIVLSTGLAFAIDRQLTQEYSACVDKSGGVTSALIDCIAAETTRQGAQLNDSYKRAISQLSSKRKNALMNAQRAWIRYRDANCKFYADPEGGTSARLAAGECALNTTADRVAELKLILQE